MRTLSTVLIALFAAISTVTVSDLTSRRVRGRLDRFPRWIISKATLRLPAEVRDDLADEWSAEMAAILRDRHVVPISRLARAVPFALGLVRGGPSVGDALIAAHDQESATVSSVADAVMAPAAPPPGLSDRDRAVLAFERQYFKYSGSKEQAIRDRFGMSATRYYQVLNALLDRSEALEFDPIVVNRLRRRRAARQRSRSTTHLVPPPGEAQ